MTAILKQVSILKAFEIFTHWKGKSSQSQRLGGSATGHPTVIAKKIKEKNKEHIETPLFYRKLGGT